MKKLLTLIAAVVLILTISTTNSFSAANSLVLVSHDSAVKGSMNDELKIHAVVKNNGTVPMNINMKLEVIELGVKHSLLVCWGTQCLPPISTFGVTTFSESLTLAPGTDSFNSFQCAINQGDADGLTIVKFSFWDANDPSDIVEFTARVDVATSVTDPVLSGLGMTITPNPAKDNITINYDLINPSPVKLSIINQLGQQVSVISNGLQQSGINSIQYDVNNCQLQNGLYFVQLLSGYKIHTEKLIIAR